MSEREMPHSEEAERCILGSIMLQQHLIDDVRATIAAEDIYRTSYRMIFEAMLQIADRGDKLDLVTLADQLESMELLEKVGGREELLNISRTVPSSENVVTYATIVKRNSILRKLIATCDDIIQTAYSGVPDFSEFIDSVDSRIFSITQQGTRKTYTPIREVLQQVYTEIEARIGKASDITGVRTGFIDVDKRTAGLQSSDLIIVAARPAMGKTSLTLNMLANVALESRVPAAFFSLEMPNNQLALRILSAEAHVDQSRIRTGRLSPEEISRLAGMVGKISEAPIFLDDTPALPIMSLRARARRMKSEHDIGIIFIDYLQLMRGSSKAAAASREQEIAEISRNLKSLAKELDIPIVALAQLNRGVDRRIDKRPLMGDLRESGAIEQDADIIVFLYRDEVYFENKEDNKNIAELIFSKHRNGAVGTELLRFTNEHTRFDSLSNEAKEYYAKTILKASPDG